MAAQGATLQTQTLEMVKCLEELHQSREALSRRIAAEAAEQAKLQKDIDVLASRLQQVTGSLAKKNTMLASYDSVISQSEEALQRIVESSATLVSVMKKSAADTARLAAAAAAVGPAGGQGG